MAVSPSARRRSTVGWISITLLGSVVVIGSANGLVDQQRQLGGAAGGALAVVFQDGGNRGVGPGAEHQRAGAGGIDPFGAIALDQAQDADAGAETLFGMRPRAQDDIDQYGGVRADRLGLMAGAP